MGSSYVYYGTYHGTRCPILERLSRYTQSKFYPSVYLSIYLSVYPSVYLSIYLSTYLARFRCLLFRFYTHYPIPSFSLNNKQEANFYQKGQITPYGQKLPYFNVDQLWKQVKETSNYDSRVQAIAQYNQVRYISINKSINK